MFYLSLASLYHRLFYLFIYLVFYLLLYLKILTKLTSSSFGKSAFRKQSRPHDLLWHQPGIHPRHPHATPPPLLVPDTASTLCIRGMEYLFQFLKRGPISSREGARWLEGNFVCESGSCGSEGRVELFQPERV